MIELALRDQLPHVAEEKREQQRRDVIAVAVGIHQQDHAAVAQLANIELGPMPVPSASIRSLTSWFSRILESASDFRVQDLPRNGRTACVRLSRPIAAVPPAESPSTMNSSLFSGSLCRQSSSLPGRFVRCEPGDLRRTSLAASRLAKRARRGQHDAADDRVGDRRISVEPGFEARADDPLDHAGQLGIIEPLLGLPLKHGVGMEDRQDADASFADVLAGDASALCA